MSASQSNSNLTIEEKRAALRRALIARPNDERLLHARRRLTTLKQIQQAAHRGVFISYSRADELFAVELADQLRSSGVPVWFDMMDAEDGDWRGQILAALDRCGLMIAVMSPASLEDREVCAERDRFLKMGKLVLPVIATPCQFNPDTYWLQPIDFSGDFDRAMKTALHALIAPVGG